LGQKNILICPPFSPIFSHDRTGYIPTLGVFLQTNEDFPLWTKALKSEIGYMMEDDPVDLTHLIRSMQRAEGHSDCFGTAPWHCDRIDCAWRKYCLEDSNEPSVKDGSQNQVSPDSYKKSEVEESETRGE
jgi:hypothetical protein